MRKSLTWLFVGVLLGLLFLTIFEPHTRMKEEGDVLYQAWFVKFPGYQEGKSYEDVINLKDFVDSNKPLADQLQVELYLEALFRQSDFATDEHVLMQDTDGHYYLYKPEREYRYFDWRANYRVSPWWKADTEE